MHLFFQIIHWTCHYLKTDWRTINGSQSLFLKKNQIMYTCSAPAYLCHDKGLLIHAFSSHSFVDLLVCLGTMACCKGRALAWNLIFDARILWNTETFRRSRLLMINQVHLISSTWPPLTLLSDMEAIREHIGIHTLLLHFGFVYVK